ncbi:phage integrase central domain-containing protein [Novacetimonas hansenii]|uniref:tyrosine-type recombinase/integrase n=1 Tax=Novacetimonas hansenii TaxID=436 RepID=UPI00248EAF03|nr:integrase arm-type DNA-binding domain-containing protein [Novacetimonas hansenii]
MSKLTAIAVKSMTRPGRYADGNGLYLHVRSADRKNWVLRFMLMGRSRDMGLGSYPDISLAAARVKALEAKGLIREGIDPIEARRVNQSPEPQSAKTFRYAAKALIEDKRPGWRNEKHVAQWVSTLERFAYPTIGDIAVQDVTIDHVLRILRPIWHQIPETASRLRGRIENVMDSAYARGWCTQENPARWKGRISTILPSQSSIRNVEHYPSLPWKRIPDFLTELSKREGMGRWALLFAILTAARSGEVRGATWAEMNLHSRVWTIPGARMKAKRPHRVPLSSHAMAVLGMMVPCQNGPDSCVFPGRRGKPISLMAMTMMLRRMNGMGTDDVIHWKDDITGEPIVPHGFRSTFRDWAAEQTNYPREMAEAALAHEKDNKVEAAYARSDLLERRRPMMQEWGNWCFSRMLGDCPADDKEGS